MYSIILCLCCIILNTSANLLQNRNINTQNFAAQRDINSIVSRNPINGLNNNLQNSNNNLLNSNNNVMNSNNNLLNSNNNILNAKNNLVNPNNNLLNLNNNLLNNNNNLLHLQNYAQNSAQRNLLATANGFNSNSNFNNPNLVAANIPNINLAHGYNLNTGTFAPAKHPVLAEVISRHNSGVNILADALQVTGSINVNGQLPVSANVGFNGRLPSEGTANVVW